MKLQTESLIQEISNIEIEIDKSERLVEEIDEWAIFVDVIRVNDLRFKNNHNVTNKTIKGYRDHMAQVFHKFEEGITNVLKTTKNEQKLIKELESIQKRLVGLDELFVYEKETESGLYEFKEGYNMNTKLIWRYFQVDEFWEYYNSTMPFFKIQRNILEQAKMLVGVTIEDLRENQAATLPMSIPQLIWNSNPDLFFIVFAVLIKEGYIVEREKKSGNISKIASYLSSFIQVEKGRGDKKKFEASTFEKYLKASEYVTHQAKGYSPKDDNRTKGYAFKKLAEQLADIIDGLDSK